MNVFLIKLILSCIIFFFTYFSKNHSINHLLIIILIYNWVEIIPKFKYIEYISLISLYLFGLILVIIQKKYKIELGYDILYFILYLSSFIFIKLIKNKYIDILKKLIPIFAFYFARELKDVRWATNADGSKYGFDYEGFFPPLIGLYLYIYIFG